MKIFSNFDTKFLEVVLKNKMKSFSREEVFIIKRSKYYLIFKVLANLIGYSLILILIFSFLTYINAFPLAYSVVAFVWVIITWFRVTHKLLKYLYDFTIVTPKGITTFKQKGILHSSIKEIPAKRIKAIEICRTTLLGNIFRYGNVDIIADLSDRAQLGADDEDSWVIGLTYVDRPYDTKEKISKTCFH